MAEFNVHQSSDTAVPDHSSSGNTSGAQSISDSLFGDECMFEGLTLSAIEVNTEPVDVTVYLDSLTQRLERFQDDYKTFADIQNIAKNSETDQSTTVNLETVTITPMCIDKILKLDKVSATITLATKYGDIHLPVPKKEAAPEYYVCFERVFQRTLETAVSMGKLLPTGTGSLQQIRKSLLAEAKQLLKYHKIDKLVAPTATLILATIIIDRVRDDVVTKVLSEMENKTRKVDPETDGMWLIGDTLSLEGNVSAARKRPITAKYRLDDHQVQLLVNLCFSTQPRTKAAAKLNLLSKVKDEISSDIKRNPAEVLARALAESELTQEEVLSVVFSTDVKTLQSRCPHCEQSVNPGMITYHGDCLVIRWLVKNFFFKHDAEQGVLTAQSARFISKTDRYLLDQLESKVRCLQGSFGLRKDGRFSQMKMSKDGMQSSYSYKLYQPTSTASYGAHQQSRH